MGGNKVSYWTSKTGLAQLESWTRDGVTEAGIAERIGIHLDTWRKWKRKVPVLEKIVNDREGSSSDRQIENALLKKASGYTIDVVKTYKLRRIEYQDGKKIREFEELEQGVDQIHVPADLSAQIFWLKNRKPEKWRDKVDTSKNSLEKLDAMMRDFRNAIQQETE